MEQIRTIRRNSIEAIFIISETIIYPNHKKINLKKSMINSERRISWSYGLMGKNNEILKHTRNSCHQRFAKINRDYKKVLTCEVEQMKLYYWKNNKWTGIEELRETTNVKMSCSWFLIEDKPKDQLNKSKSGELLLEEELSR